MTLISIRERGLGSNGAVVIIEGQEYPLPEMVRGPFSEKEESRLEWYFEQYLKFPVIRRVEARTAARSIAEYGEKLFGQVFADERALGSYRAALRRGVETLTIEVIGSPEFQQLHWEALKDPMMPQALSIHARMVRRSLQPRAVAERVGSSRALNILVVTARPGAGRDVGYRTISRALMEALRQSEVRGSIEILRPGTFEALARHLKQTEERHGAGHYHVIHFDVHGALLSYDEYMRQRYHRRGPLAAYDGRRAFLFMEGEHDGELDPVEATELEELLRPQQIQIAVLNACQSGKQVGATETSLGSQLMHAGVPRVVAMGYSVTVSAAELLMGKLYQRLFVGADLCGAVRDARKALYERKERRGWFNQRVEMEDWLLPVVYENQPQPVMVGEFTVAELAADEEEKKRRYRGSVSMYGFFGRDLDILRIERRVLTRRNVLLVRGMAGAGKSTLLHHLGEWWQETGLVGEVFYFGYDTRRWTRQQLVEEIGRRLYGSQEFERRMQSKNEGVQQEMVVEKLLESSCLVILDNLESITGTQLAIPNRLTKEEQEELISLLSALVGGKTLVLLGSRGEEKWLAPGTFEDNSYELPGLDEEAAAELAERVLVKHGAERYRDDADLRRLLKLLDGYPLALEVVMANVGRRSPKEVLDALEGGSASLDASHGGAEGEKARTRSLLACIGYSNSNLSPGAQQLLQCLAPFTGVIHREWLVSAYTERLRAQSELAGLPYEQWDEVLAEAERWGLLTSRAEWPMYLQLQPILPYFLRQRLHDKPEIARAVHAAFRLHHEDVGTALAEMCLSVDPQERQAGLELIGLEYENLHTAMCLALTEHEDFYRSFCALLFFLQGRHAHAEALALCDRVIEAVRGYEKQGSDLGEQLLTILGNKATLQLELRQHDAAASTYEEVLDRVNTLPGISDLNRLRYRASVYHQMGNVSHLQRDWTRAEESYQKALELKAQLGDRHSQAKTYYQMGRVTQDQRKWKRAEDYYRKALDLFRDVDDRSSQGSTWHQLGVVAQEQRDWEQAKKHYQKALRLKREFGDQSSEASTHHQLGRIAQEQREWSQAEAHYQKALEIKIRINDRYSQASTYQQLGAVAQEQRSWMQAEEYYRKAQDLYVEFDDRHGQAKVEHQMGRVMQERRVWRQAEAHYRKALDLLVNVDDQYLLANTYHQLGIIEHLQGRLEHAEDCYRKALAIFEAFKDEYALAIVYHQFGRLEEDRLEWSRAEELYQKALAGFVQFGDRRSQAIVLHQLGTVAQGQRDWTKAEERYQSALEFQNSDPYAQAGTWHQLGRVAHEQRDWARAGERYEKALALFAEYEDIHGAALTVRSLSNLARDCSDAGVAERVARLLRDFTVTAERLLRERQDTEEE
jgi:tetratricopeptide (TPR) repeat protein